MAKLQRGVNDPSRPEKNRPIVPTALITGPEGAKCYLQNGCVFSLDGNEMAEPPEWVRERLAAMQPSERENLGFAAKAKKAKEYGA